MLRRIILTNSKECAIIQLEGQVLRWLFCRVCGVVNFDILTVRIIVNNPGAAIYRIDDDNFVEKSAFYMAF